MTRAALSSLLVALCAPLPWAAAPAAAAKPAKVAAKPAPAKAAAGKPTPPAGKGPSSTAKAAAPAAQEKDPPGPPKAEVTAEDVEAGKADQQRAVAEQLLKALSKQAGEEGLGVVLGGASLVSRIFAIDDWEVVGREKRRVETGDFASAKRLLAALDLERKKANRELVSAPPLAPAPKSADVAMSGVSAVDDAWTFELVRDRARELEETHPVLGFLLGADRAEFGYANDPFRKMLVRTPRGGRYALELDQFWIRTNEGHHEEKVARRFPVYVFRLKAGRFDSGYKVLPTTETTGASAAEVCR